MGCACQLIIKEHDDDDDDDRAYIQSGEARANVGVSNDIYCQRLQGRLHPYLRSRCALLRRR